MKHLTSKQYRILTSLVAMMAMMGVEAQTAPEVPRLVVNIVVDQLRSDYLEAFSPLFGNNGFVKLMEQGRVYSQAEYPFNNPDRASAISSLMSGTVPHAHGVVGEKWMDRTTLLPVYCAEDKEYPGNGTNEYTSPRALGVSTITDELKVSTEGKSIIYGVAPTRDAAVFSAGHAANGAFWINDQTGQWCSTSYYGTAPTWLNYYNSLGHALCNNVSTEVWEPSNELVGGFNYFVSGGMKKPFRHAFKGDRRFIEYKTSGLVNEEVTDFAIHCLSNGVMGVDQITDFLSVTYYAGNYDHKTIAECPMEIQDTYVRLDAQLARLIEVLDKKVGHDRVLVVLTSTGYSDTEQGADDLSRYRIPSGDFNISRAYLLLNMYLTAVYGPANYVDAVMGNQLYLNLKLIENKGINLTELLERTAAFLIQLSGVRDVYTSERLAQGAWTPGISKIRNAFNPKLSGDIVIQVAPGWHLVNDDTHERTLQRESYMGFPLYFYGAGIENEQVNTPVSVEHVAPTLAQFMRIRAPNACSASPLLGVRKNKQTQ